MSWRPTTTDRFVDHVLREAGLRLMETRGDGALEDWSVLLPYIRRILEDAVWTLISDVLVDEDNPELAVIAVRRLKAKMDAIDQEREARAEAGLRYFADERREKLR